MSTTVLILVHIVPVWGAICLESNDLAQLSDTRTFTRKVFLFLAAGARTWILALFRTVGIFNRTFTVVQRHVFQIMQRSWLLL